MKAYGVVLLAAFTTASAQSIVIGAPTIGAKLRAGQSIVVDIVRPDFLSSSLEVAVAIGISSCTSNFCPPTTDTLGSLLYSGPFNPQRDLNNHILQPFQKFTVNVPAIIPRGPATIGVAHFALIGASLGP